LNTIRAWVPSMEIPPLAADAPRCDVTVRVCTFNRSADLTATLDTLKHLQVDAPLTWELVVVDNNSNDDTREVVSRAAHDFPAPLRYVFEPTQGKSNALNTGLRSARGRFIAFTDDDVRVPPEWLMKSIAPLLDHPALAYTGGRVRPMWQGRRPSWLDERGRMGGTIAVTDHGSQPFVFEERHRIPLGVNMTVRRELLEQVGGFHPDLGRTGRSLLGQEQADFFYRSRRAGARGLYVPDAVLDHAVPASRLNRRYFRRWWYWKGLSHARLHALHGTTELGIDLRTTPFIGSVPRYLVRSFARHVAGWITATLLRRRREAAEHLCIIAYVIGYVREARNCRRDAKRDGRPGSSVPVSDRGRGEWVT
jgi:glycosyltransferase involved in cell wall biosynthesis